MENICICTALRLQHLKEKSYVYDPLRYCRWKDIDSISALLPQLHWNLGHGVAGIDCPQSCMSLGCNSFLKQHRQTKKSLSGSKRSKDI